MTRSEAEARSIAQAIAGEFVNSPEAHLKMAACLEAGHPNKAGSPERWFICHTCEPGYAIPLSDDVGHWVSTPHPWLEWRNHAWTYATRT